MKTIHLIRHAKSSWAHPELRDIDRPLNQRGEKDCKIMAAALFEAGVKFKNVYCSSALRARLTINNILDHWQGKPFTWHVTNDMYVFSCHQLIQLITQLDETLDVVTLIGHNPAFTDLINKTCGDHSSEALANFATCAYAHINFSVSHWSDVTSESARLYKMMKPKMYKKSSHPCE